MFFKTVSVSITDYLPHTCIIGYFEECCQFWTLCWQLILYEFAILIEKAYFTGEILI